MIVNERMKKQFNRSPNSGDVIVLNPPIRSRSWKSVHEKSEFVSLDRQDLKCERISSPNILQVQACQRNLQFDRDLRFIQHGFVSVSHSLKLFLVISNPSGLQMTIGNSVNQRCLLPTKPHGGSDAHRWHRHREEDELLRADQAQQFAIHGWNSLQQLVGFLGW